MEKKIISLIDSGRFNNVLENFNKTTGFVTAILDLKGNILFRSGWRRICTDFHRVHPETEKNCIESDTRLGSRPLNKKRYNLYRCKNGMTDACVPIILNNKHVANLFTGQFFINKPDKKYFREQARKYNLDEKEYLKALDEVPVVSEERVENLMAFLISLADLIMNLATQNHKEQTLSENLSLGEEIAGFGSWEFDLNKMMVNPSKGALRIFGALDFQGPKTIELTQSLVLPQYRSMMDRTLQELIENNTPYDVEYKIARLDNSEVVDVHAKAEYDGKKNIVFGVIHDITKQKKLEDQLFHSKKMDSIGRLAGGVAHDYNNAISAIMGFTQFAIDRLESSPWVDELTVVLNDLDEVLAASKSAADITSQLLSFSRNKPITPEVINLNSSLKKIYKMLKRLIGEDILFDMKPSDDLWPIEIAPTQLDQLLLNLCVNARDAIFENNNGKLSGEIKIVAKNITIDSEKAVGFIDSLNFKPGDYVHISISDTGCGIPEELQLNIFEPFFTTKDKNKGTGLGLATVYGIIQQNKGYINVSSVPDKATVFNLYLPKYKHFKPSLQKKKLVKPVRLPLDGIKTLKKENIKSDFASGYSVLLVEDDPAVLRMTEKILKKYGFTVLSANTPGKAIDLALNHDNKMDLLITDMILPELSGQKLAEKIKKKYPSLKTIFMSGYATDEIKQKNSHENSFDLTNFIQKPFKVSELKKIIETVMGT